MLMGKFINMKVFPACIKDSGYRRFKLLAVSCSIFAIIIIPCVISGVCYLSVYETLRHILFTNNVKDTRLVALLSGGGASVVGQSIIVPFDVVSQHMMMTGIHTTADKVLMSISVTKILCYNFRPDLIL